MKSILATITAIALFIVVSPASAQFTIADVDTDTLMALNLNGMHAAVQLLKARTSSDGAYTQVALGKAAHEWAMARITADAMRLASADTSSILFAMAAADFRKRFERPSAKDREFMANMFVTELMQGMTTATQLKAIIPAVSNGVISLQARVIALENALKDSSKAVVSTTARMDSLMNRVVAIEDSLQIHSDAIQQNATNVADARQETADAVRQTGAALYGNGAEKKAARTWFAGRR